MVYKIRVILDTKEDIFRDVEIKGKQTLWNLHLGIKSAFNLSGDELSTFNLLEEDGTVVKSVPLEDMSDDGDGEIMSDVYIDEAFESAGDKAQFQYGLLDLWEFFCELVEVVEETKGVNYPLTAYRFGNAPLKAPSKNKSAAGSKNKKSAMPLMDDDFNFDDDFGGGSNNFADEDDDSFDDEEEDDYNDDVFDDEDDDNER
ncbi:plasmid pRiA4b ORF-3 family protein [Chryseobacterium sp. LC2016-29]|uniref:plasmid pRiA4b ORF-3 family protein n=1 Tax=Chryseobacterium sp. LC2016-29 TaxID=2897331 RepID=UPI000F929297|nr:plasmid pRiA4b ORF-3 family protein [Chryseobacterium sp. LC2016-29]MCD0480195.1 plasmid pRiA4b ORF-3 family protein [Chryseobacterium sp. LC2016-29]